MLCKVSKFIMQFEIYFVQEMDKVNHDKLCPSE